MLALANRTTEGPEMTHQPTHTQAPPGVLLLADVARIFTEEARKQYDQRVAKLEEKNARRRLKGLGVFPPLREFTGITAETARTYLKQSKPMFGSKPGRYADNPMPPPAGRIGTARQVPWWPAGDEQKLRDWFNSRPGYDHGTGGRYAGRTRAGQ